jgi:hypothetical protein
MLTLSGDHEGRPHVNCSSVLCVTIVHYPVPNLFRD